MLLAFCCVTRPKTDGIIIGNILGGKSWIQQNIKNKESDN